MKPSNLIIVIIIVLSVNIVLSQKSEENIFLKKLYLKAGLEFSNFSNNTIFKSGSSAYEREGTMSYTGSLGYEYTNKLLFELQYKYMDGFSYKYDKGLFQYYSNGERYYLSGQGNVKSHYINLRANYFVNENRKDNPIYFIGAMNFGIQQVNNREQYEYNDRDETVTTKSTRFVLGPEAGFGIFFDLGIISFHTEFTFSSRISPLTRDKKYSENSLTLNFSPILNFK